MDIEQCWVIINKIYKLYINHDFLAKKCSFWSSDWHSSVVNSKNWQNYVYFQIDIISLITIFILIYYVFNYIFRILFISPFFDVKIAKSQCSFFKTIKNFKNLEKLVFKMAAILNYLSSEN